MGWHSLVALNHSPPSSSTSPSPPFPHYASAHEYCSTPYTPRPGTIPPPACSYPAAHCTPQVSEQTANFPTVRLRFLTDLPGYTNCPMDFVGCCRGTCLFTCWRDCLSKGATRYSGIHPLTPYTRRVAAVSTATLFFPLRRISHRLVPLQMRYRWCLDQMCPISVIPTFSTNASSSDALA